MIKRRINNYAKRRKNLNFTKTKFSLIATKRSKKKGYTHDTQSPKITLYTTHTPLISSNYINTFKNLCVLYNSS